jgi:hypothetical protein
MAFSDIRGDNFLAVVGETDFFLNAEDIPQLVVGTAVFVSCGIDDTYETAAGVNPFTDGGNNLGIFPVMTAAPGSAGTA